MLSSDIDALKPGMELDKLVAEKLGWEDFYEADEHGWGVELWGTGILCGSVRVRLRVPKFSRHMSPAWKVWNKLPDTWQDMPAKWRIDKTGPDTVSVAIGRPADDEHEGWWIVWADGTAPEAICKAFLKTFL